MQVNEKHKFHTTFHPGSIKRLRRLGGGLREGQEAPRVLAQRHYHAGGSLSRRSDLEGGRVGAGGNMAAPGMR